MAFSGFQSNSFQGSGFQIARQVTDDVGNSAGWDMHLPAIAARIREEKYRQREKERQIKEAQEAREEAEREREEAEKARAELRERDTREYRRLRLRESVQVKKIEKLEALAAKLFTELEEILKTQARLQDDEEAIFLLMITH